MIAAATIVAIAARDGDRRHQLVDTTDPPATSAAESTSPASTSPPSSSPAITSAPATDPATSVTSPEVSNPVNADPAPITVSFREPPPALDVVPITGEWGADASVVAIGDTAIYVVDSAGRIFAHQLLPGSAQGATYAFARQPIAIAAGPDEVLYALLPSDDGTSVSIVAMALVGDRAGQIIAENPLGSIRPFVPVPVGLLGHGPTGIVDRRTGAQLIGYVEPYTGGPTTLHTPAHQVTVAGDVVHDPDGAHDWLLAIERAPDSGAPVTGESPPAPSSHGGAALWTFLGPPDPDDLSGDTLTLPVLALLAADGSGQWWSIPEGWQVAASDVGGTVLRRDGADGVELALVQPPRRVDFVNRPMRPTQRVAQTLPTALTTAPPCLLDDLAVDLSVGGAMGTLYATVSVRNSSAVPCSVRGAVDVELLDGSGSVVQSTDPALLTPAAVDAAPDVVLVPDSSSFSWLGAVSSSVCGGLISSQIRIAIAGSTTTQPFPIDVPWDPSCGDPPRASPGELQPTPFDVYLPAQQPTFAQTQLASAGFALIAPPAARAGQVLRFEITITATSDAGAVLAIADNSCPVYTAALQDASGGTVATEQQLLNCDGQNGILLTAGESVTFHIELPVPAGATAGSATLSFTSDEPTGLAASTPIVVEAG